MSVNKIQSAPREITLRRWRVIEIELPGGVRSRHVWGHDAEKNAGRASSAIETFDKETLVATTRSGSTYRLTGLPGNSRLGKSAWNDWCKESKVVSECDVTHEYLDVNKISTVGFERLKHNVL